MVCETCVNNGQIDILMGYWVIRKEALEEEFKGLTVAVPRSHGVVDREGWTIDSNALYHQATKDYWLRVIHHDKGLSKTVPLSLLRQYKQ